MEIDISGLSRGCLFAIRCTLIRWSNPPSREEFGDHYDEINRWYTSEQRVIKNIDIELDRRNQCTRPDHG